MTATRRQFLHAALGAGAALAGGVGDALDAHAAGAHSAVAESLSAISKTSRALGTQVAITALHRDAAVAASAIDDAFAAIEQVETLMSIYRAESELSRLNRDGRLDDPHPLFVGVLRYACELSRRTGGAFDVTVQPLWRLYADAQQQGRIPTQAEVAAARRRVDWKSVEIDRRGVRLTRPAAEITLNGIAQGLAADRAVAALRASGIRHALVDSGELGGLGGKSSAAPWKVGIQHPRRAAAYVSLAALRDRCLATSGDYATRFGDDFEYNHLFDPGTGRSPRELSSVSVAAPTGMQADALSTAVFVLGAERGLELIRRTPGADALLIRKSGRMLATAGFPLWQDPEVSGAEEADHG